MSLDTTTPKTPAGPVGALAPLAVPIDTLDYLPGNPRRGDVPAVAASLARFGQRKPIVAKRDGTVIAGNHTLEAARSLGWETIAVVYVDDDDATAKAFALADNRTAELGSYDDEALAELIAAVRDADEVLYGATGWTDADLDELVAKIEAAQPRPALTDPDDVPDQAPGITVPGDVWLLGPHRVVCGDSTVPTDVDRALDGATPDLMLTDPPYGIGVSQMTLGTGKRQFHRGGSWDAERPDLSTLVDLAPTVVIWGGNYFADVLPITNDWLVWHKKNDGLSFSEVELAWTNLGCNTRLLAHHWAGEAKLHPTMKPVAVLTWCLDFTPDAALIFDPFAGSGSTLIAAHQTGRRAALIELDPAYVDVICRRYQQHTDTLPINATTGKAHDFCA